MHGDAEVDLHYLGTGGRSGVGQRCGHGDRRVRAVRRVDRDVGEVEGGVGQAEPKAEQRLDALR